MKYIIVLVVFLLATFLLNAEELVTFLTIEGLAPLERLGRTVACAGDANGDGIPDVIVGGYGSNVAYIYYGEPNIDDEPDLILSEEVEGCDWGYGLSVAGVGDLNQDGFTDVAVGAPHDQEGGLPAGKVWLYFGGEEMNNTADLIFAGSGGEWLGYSIAGTGDINGDGAPDLGISPGYIFFGGDGIDVVPDLTITPSLDHWMTSCVAGVGDINSDGFLDVAVGGAQSSHTSPSWVYVYFGGLGMDTIPDLILSGGELTDFGISIAGLGDINEDGFDDFIVGAPDMGPHGTAYLYFGGPELDDIPDLTLEGEGEGTGFGNSVASAGDVDGDLKPDIVIGASYGYEQQNDSQNKVYIFYGGSDIDAIPDQTITGDEDRFGISVAGPGNITSYEQPEIPTDCEILVGAMHNSIAGERAGRVYIYSVDQRLIPDIDLSFRSHDFEGVEIGDSFIGALTIYNSGLVTLNVANISSDHGDFVASPTHGTILPGESMNVVVTFSPSVSGSIQGRLTILSDDPYIPSMTVNLYGEGIPPVPPPFFQVFEGDSQDVHLGRSVTFVSDINQDGYDDVAAGAPSDAQYGGAFIFFGGPNMDDAVDLILRGEPIGSGFGASMTLLGDANGDGASDMIIGAPGAKRAYIFFGGPLDSFDLVLSGDGDVEGFGRSVAGGDLNGDEYVDAVVGSGADEVYIYFGGPGMDAMPDLVLVGDGGFFGYSVGAGDVNGDGNADILVGVPSHRGSEPYSGLIYVFLGGLDLDDLPDLTLVGDEVYLEYFGRSVAVVEDVNGDGFQEMFIGAPHTLDYYPSWSTGKAFLFFGGPDIDTIPDLILSDNGNVNDFFGWTVAGSDINGDNYTDLIVGAPRDTSTGLTYVFLGGPELNPDYDLILGGEETGDKFGYAVAGGGDVDGDGVLDMLMGAPYNDYREPDAGRIYIYRGHEGMASFIRGDANADMVVGISDAIFTLRYLFVPGSPEPFCMNAADIDDNGLISMNDALYTLRHLFIPGSPEPPPPYPSCGVDPTPVELGCESHPCMGGVVKADGGNKSGGSLVLANPQMEGKRVTISVYLNNLLPLSGFAYTVSYDPSVLRFVELETKRLVAENFDFVSALPGDGQLTIGNVVSFDFSRILPEGDYQVANLIFEAGRYDHDILLKFTDAELVDVNATSLKAKASDLILRDSKSPKAFAMRQAFPNPFIGETTIRYQLPEESHVALKIYNASGQLVNTIVDEIQKPGYYSVEWNSKDDSGRKLASGVYFYRIEVHTGLGTGEFTSTRKLILLQ